MPGTGAQSKTWYAEWWQVQAMYVFNYLIVNFQELLFFSNVVLRAPSGEEEEEMDREEDGREKEGEEEEEEDEGVRRKMMRMKKARK